MGIKSIIGATCTCLAAVSFNVNAVVVNTLNGINYEWLDFTATAGMSRLDVEAQLMDVNSPLYGYEYASRALVEDLLLSYSSWDGLSGWHDGFAPTTGMNNFLNDFGRLVSRPDDTIPEVSGTVTTVDGIVVPYDALAYSRYIFGTRWECYSSWSHTTCTGEAHVVYNNGDPAAADQLIYDGWDSLYYRPATVMRDSYFSSMASLLVRETAVPVPPAVWLFGTGLLGLIGVARRKARA